MDILIGLNKFRSFTGSETYTYYLAKELLRRGHRVDIYGHYGCGTPLVDSALKVGYWDRLSIDKSEKSYDVLHVMQPKPTVHLLQTFVDVPIVSTSHGLIEEEWPVRAARILKQICVSEEVREHVRELWSITPSDIL